MRKRYGLIGLLAGLAAMAAPAQSTAAQFNQNIPYQQAATPAEQHGVMTVQRKRTFLGNPTNKQKHWWAVVPQKHRKHTNTNHLKADARRKRKAKRNGR